MFDDVEAEFIDGMRSRLCELVDEASRSIAETEATTGEDRQTAFEAWAIQKLAILQVLVEVFSIPPDRPGTAKPPWPAREIGTRRWEA